MPAAEAFPTIRLGRHTVSRLIVGGNSVSGSLTSRPGSAGRCATTSPPRTSRSCCPLRGGRHQHLAVARRPPHPAAAERVPPGGGQLQWIAQTASELADIPRHIRDLAAAAPSASTTTAHRPTSSGGGQDRDRRARCAKSCATPVSRWGWAPHPRGHRLRGIQGVGRGFLHDLRVQHEPHERGGGASSPAARSRTTSYSGTRTARRC